MTPVEKYCEGLLEASYGLAPPKAEMGDVIAILHGCSVPVVPRTHSSVPLAWELIGKCFVYGKMDGGAMKSSTYGGRPGV
ncbi:hypothetical protein WAI453_008151 [Rhynchosporium graminicola]